MRRPLQVRVIPANVMARQASVARVTPASLPGHLAAGASRRCARARVAGKRRTVGSISNARIVLRAAPVDRRKARAMQPVSALRRAMDQAADLAMERAMRRVRTLRETRLAGQTASERGRGAIGAAGSAETARQCSRPMWLLLQARKAPTAICSRAALTARHVPVDRAARVRRAAVVAVPVIDRVASRMQVAMLLETRLQQRRLIRTHEVQPTGAQATAIVAVAAVLRAAIEAVDRVREGLWKSRAVRRAGASASRVIGRTICRSSHANGWTRCLRRCARRPGKVARQAATHCAGSLRPVLRRRSLSESVADGCCHSSVMTSRPVAAVEPVGAAETVANEFARR